MHAEDSGESCSHLRPVQLLNFERKQGANRRAPPTKEPGEFAEVFAAGQGMRCGVLCNYLEHHLQSPSLCFLQEMEQKLARHAGSARRNRDTHTGKTRDPSRARKVTEAAKASCISCETAITKIGALRANEPGERGRIHGEGAANIALETFRENPCLIGQRNVMRGNDIDQHR